MEWKRNDDPYERYGRSVPVYQTASKAGIHLITYNFFRMLFKIGHGFSDISPNLGF